MNNDKKMFYLFSLLIIVASILFNNSFVIKFLWIFLTICLLIKYRFPRDKNFLKSAVIRIVIISILSYFLISYGLGLIVGFGRNVFDLKLTTILKNISFPIIIILCQEIIRYIYAKNCLQDKKPYIMLTCAYIFANISYSLFRYNFNDFEEIFKFICLVFLPAVADDALYSFITYKVSIVPTLIMKLVFGIYLYIIPIFPNLGNYLISVFGILYPFFVYLLISEAIKRYDKVDRYVVSVSRKYLLFPFIVLSSILVVLISGVSGYKLIAIASGSMSPTYDIGDAIIYKKVSNIEEIDVGCIIAYNLNGSLITHRVVDVTSVNDKKIYVTKGDYNNKNDDYMVYDDMIVGTVMYKIPYMGYPTIWINDFFDKV